jgi:hypothetical protein
MKKHSCGAILYTEYNGTISIVLGLERGDWYPFKGVRERSETNQMAAIREIYEETCGVVKVIELSLGCNFSTKRKHYHIGLVKISMDEIKQFDINRRILLGCSSTKWAYLEKSAISMFAISDINTTRFHEVTYRPIKYYMPYLMRLQKNLMLLDAQTDNRFEPLSLTT